MCGCFGLVDVVGVFEYVGWGSSSSEIFTNFKSIEEERCRDLQREMYDPFQSCYEVQSNWLAEYGEVQRRIVIRM